MCHTWGDDHGAIEAVEGLHEAVPRKLILHPVAATRSIGGRVAAFQVEGLEGPICSSHGGHEEREERELQERRREEEKRREEEQKGVAVTAVLVSLPGGLSSDAHLTRRCSRGTRGHA